MATSKRKGYTRKDGVKVKATTVRRKVVDRSQPVGDPYRYHRRGRTPAELKAERDEYRESNKDKRRFEVLRGAARFLIVGERNAKIIAGNDGEIRPL